MFDKILEFSFCGNQLVLRTSRHGLVNPDLTHYKDGTNDLSWPIPTNTSSYSFRLPKVAKDRPCITCLDFVSSKDFPWISQGWPTRS